MVKKIDINQLRKGMYVCGTDRKWIDLPFFRTKFLIKSDNEINTLREYCRWIDIDTAKGLDVAQASEPSSDGAPAPSQTSPVDDNDPLVKLYQHSLIAFGECLSDAGLNNAFEHSKIEKIVAGILNAVAADSLTMIDLIQRKFEQAGSLAQKSVNVLILALAFGRYLGLATDRLLVLGAGALLHDVGMLVIPDGILLKTEMLTDAEWAEISKHPEHGQGLLAKTPTLSAEVLDIVATHHEQLDGGGYPNGLTAERIGELARITSIVSVYEALVGQRVYRKSLPPSAAMELQYAYSVSIFDASLLANFMQMLGVFPGGCTVELRTGELAIVARDNPRFPSRPLINIITNPEKQLLFQGRSMDLADEAHQNQSIVKVLASDEPILELLKMFTQVDKV